MTSSEIRQSFLDFFHSKNHSIVRSSSLLPDSPNLLFTNAGMNQFVPFFLGQRQPDVSRWAGAMPGSDLRAADTQKCIRAGGKHNDLDDVGLDTYHHTFFEMLGNWSFGDYFKADAITWAWELIVGRWKFPAERLYATIYQPEAGDPSGRDQEAWDLWAEKFRAAGLDPAIHIVDGNKKDNFWMMGETGPCGPCSELHVDLTPAGDTAGRLVNKGSPSCIEIWNLVFIQFNANPDGTFSPLPARHVDTGMGFERVASIIQGTKGFTDFANARISNYETDVFRPVFDEIERLSGFRYGSTLPREGSAGDSEEERRDVAFRVIADHIRTLSFAIADGIQPGNSERHYVLRRILRRAVRYGRTLGFREPFFHKLVAVLARSMGGVFPELRERQAHIEEVLRLEEETFNRTLDKGIALFNEAAARGPIDGAFAFRLYDEQGFPLDLTELMARERGLTVDTAGFEALMEQQRARARAAQKREVISLSEVDGSQKTVFTGFETSEADATVLQVVRAKDKIAVVLDQTPCFAEMGGQVGDQAAIHRGDRSWGVLNTIQSGPVRLHLVDGEAAPEEGSRVSIAIDAPRRRAIERHHTATHLLHWALHRVVLADATQKGSSVSPEKLTFDFNSPPLTPAQIEAIERLVNERILENATVSWTEFPYDQVKGRPDVMQFFGDRYGDMVRVVQIGGEAGALNGYSMELCGGTHVRSTGQTGLFRITSESAVAAGIRRIEAVAGFVAWQQAVEGAKRLEALAARLNAPLGEIERKIDALLENSRNLEKAWKAAQIREADAKARELIAAVESQGGVSSIIADLGAVDGDFLQAVLDALKGRFEGIAVLAGHGGGAVSLAASISPAFITRFQAGKIIQSIAPLVGGKGGGKPDQARGGGRQVDKIPEALARVKALLQESC